MKEMLIGLGIVGLIVFLCYCAIESEKAFSLEMKNTYDSCINDGESKWVCESLIASKKAERKADSASASANMALGMSAASMAR